MKYLIVGLLLGLPFVPPCRAEMQFPAYESLSPNVQKAWGYTVEKLSGKNPSLLIHVPPAAAPYCSRARLNIRDAEGHLLAEANMGLNRAKDGGLGFEVNLLEQLHGSAELVIYTSEIPGGPSLEDFGGFTFSISN